MQSPATPTAPDPISWREEIVDGNVPTAIARALNALAKAAPGRPLGGRFEIATFDAPREVLVTHRAAAAPTTADLDAAIDRAAAALGTGAPTGDRRGALREIAAVIHAGGLEGRELVLEDENVGDHCIASSLADAEAAGDAIAIEVLNELQLMDHLARVAVIVLLEDMEPADLPTHGIREACGFHGTPGAPL